MVNMTIPQNYENHNGGGNFHGSSGWGVKQGCESYNNNIPCLLYPFPTLYIKQERIEIKFLQKGGGGDRN